MEDQYLMLVHPENEKFVRKHAKKILKEVFEAKGKVTVVAHASFDLSTIHTFLNGEYIGYVAIHDEGKSGPVDESKLPTNVN